MKVEMMNWRDLPPTEKQLEYIAHIQEEDEYRVVPAFCGKTRGEACDFIDKYRKYAYESTWAIEHGYD